MNTRTLTWGDNTIILRGNEDSWERTSGEPRGRLTHAEKDRANGDHWSAAAAPIQITHARKKCRRGGKLSASLVHRVHGKGVGRQKEIERGGLDITEELALSSRSVNSSSRTWATLDAAVALRVLRAFDVTSPARGGGFASVAEQRRRRPKHAAKRIL